MTDDGGIESKILTIRGLKVILDGDLAALYGVQTKRLNEQVKRNLRRFPEDFVFQLTAEELDILRSQFATAKYLKTRTLPYAFTEHGAIQAANVLNSEQAVEMGVQVVRAFVRMRQMLSTMKELSGKMKELEGRVGYHDKEIEAIMTVIQQLMEPPPPLQEPPVPARKIGFNA